VAFRIDQVAAVKVRALVDGAAAVVLDAAAPGKRPAGGIARAEFEPNVEAVDCAAGEEVPDLAGANDRVDADGAPGLKRDTGSVERGGDFADFAEHDGAGLLGFLADGKSGGLSGRVGRAA